MNRLFSWLLGYGIPALMLIAGLFGLSTSASLISTGYASLSWPSVLGTVTRSEFGSESTFHRTEDRTRYWPIVEYEFAVNGQRYQSANIRFDGLRSGTRVGNGKAETEAMLALYPVGTDVKVRYDPKDPTRSSLLSGVTVDQVWLPLFSLVLAGVGSTWLWMMWSSRVGELQNGTNTERMCPKCSTVFSSVQDKGVCPGCNQLFYASDHSSS